MISPKFKSKLLTFDSGQDAVTDIKLLFYLKQQQQQDQQNIWDIGFQNTRHQAVKDSDP